MKQLITLLTCMLLYCTLIAQVPDKLSYQGLARNSSGEILANWGIGVEYTIYEQSTLGLNAVYCETQTISSNENGLLSAQIGAGAIDFGDLDEINWGEKSSQFFIGVRFDFKGGTNYTTEGMTEILSVPYALYAKNSGSSTPGPEGPQGAAGPQGPQGNDGAPGPQGPAGMDGEDGMDGPQGPQGPAGMDGDDGNDAPSNYELWLEDGNVGTLEDFLNEFGGPEGPQGPAGMDGADGANGIDGTDGMDGAPGADGMDGAPGADGIDGAPGADGMDGAPGADGMDGAPGADGMDGAPGADGMDGAPGADGMDGAPGADGMDGAPGADGMDGAPGADGMDGAPGADGMDGANGLQGPPGSANISGSTGRIIKFNGTSSGSNSIMTENGSTITVDGYIKTGTQSFNPALQIKDIEFNTASMQGGTTSALHFLNASKIISVTVLVDGTPDSYVAQDGYYFNFYFDNSSIYIELSPDQAFNILNSPAKVVFFVQQ